MATIDGDTDDNELIGGGDDDVLTGFAGNDTLTGGLGLDALFGGAGNDILIIADPPEAESDETYHGGGGTDTLRVISEGSSISNADLRNADISSIERIEITTGGSILSTTLRIDADDIGAGIALDATIVMSGNANQNERLNIRVGSETNVDLSGFTVIGAREDLLGDGFVVSGTSAFDLIGSDISDTVYSAPDGSRIEGRKGADYLSSVGGMDTVVIGGSGDDWLDNDTAQGRLFGGKGDDRITFAQDVSPGVGATVDGGKGVDLLELRANGAASFDLTGAQLSNLEAFKLDFRVPGDTDVYSIRFEAEQWRSGFSSDASFSATSGDVTVFIDFDAGATLDLSDITFDVANLRTQITGAAGDQTINGGTVNDSIYGDTGADTLIGGDGQDSLVGGNGRDELAGNAAADVLFGGNGDDLLGGGGGADSLVGGAGNDILGGRKGADKLRGGDGADTLTGDGGADTFIYRGVSDSATGAENRDTITSPTSNDTLLFEGFDADTITLGDQAFAFIGTTAFSNTAGELRTKISNNGENLRVIGDVDGDGLGDFEILLLDVTTFEMTIETTF